MLDIPTLADNNADNKALWHQLSTNPLARNGGVQPLMALRGCP